jgi:two-component system NtrC family sensor kinase
MSDDVFDGAHAVADRHDVGPAEELADLRATVARQEQIIAALVDAAERRWDSVTRLGIQHVIERRTAKAHQAERVLRSVIEALDGALCIVGADGTVLDANGAWLREPPWHLPAPRDGSERKRSVRPGQLGTDFFDWCRSAAGLGDLAEEIEALVREVISADVDAVAIRAAGARTSGQRSVKGLVNVSGQARWVVVRVNPIRDHVAARAVVSMIDITEGMSTQEKLRRATEEAELLAGALSQEKNLLTGVISAVPQLVYWKNAEGRYVGCNAAFLAFRGLQERQLLGRSEAELASEDALMCALAELEPQVTRSGRAVVDRKMDLADNHGQLRSLLLSVLPLDDATAGGRGVIGVGADITRARELERQLAQANRLESIGQLAAGIAHEINTPIQYVADNVAFLSDATDDLLSAAQRIAGFVAEAPSRDIPATEITAVLDPLDLDFLGEEIPGALSQSKEGLGRVTEIVRAMKEYAHPGTTRREIDVNRAVESTVQVCRNEWKYVAKVELDLDSDVGLVPCYEGELKQVILNMVVNAAQAIGDDARRRADGDLGTISISTRRTGDELLIVIRDDGPGMDESIRQRVFDPFFTTKEVGKGSGQGLSIAHAVIVTKHQGRIDLDTAPGEGTCFTLHLPLTVSAEPPPER